MSSKASPLLLRLRARGDLRPIALLLALFAVGCGNAVTATPGGNNDTPEKVARPVFDEKKAWDYLLKQCDFGPRPVGSAAHQRTRDYLLAEMKKYADKTATQDFTYRGMPLTNIIGVFNPEAKRKVILCAHWDTRPVADEEIDAAKRRQPIIGASDGASGVAVLLELARLFKEQKPEVGIVMVFFDGEDYGSFERDEGVFLGSRHFAKNIGEYKAEYGILLDMVGDKDLNIYREQNSQNSAPAINNKVFRIAKELGHGKYFVDNGQFTNVVDDHLPLIQAGVPTIDLIDFDYGSWHRLSDTPDMCSPNSLKVVGEVVAEVIYREKASKPTE